MSLMYCFELFECISSRYSHITSSSPQSLEFILGLDVITAELDNVYVNDNPLVTFPFMENGEN